MANEFQMIMMKSILKNNRTDKLMEIINHYKDEKIKLSAKVKKECNKIIKELKEINKGEYKTGATIEGRWYELLDMYYRTIRNN